MPRNYDAEIANAEKTWRATLDHMERVREEFVAATVAFVQPFLIREAEAYAKGNPEKTKAHGRDKLAEMKAEVLTVQSEIPDVAAQILNDDSLWWHRQPKEEYYFSSNPHRLPDNIDTAVRLIAGRLGPVLEKYEYVPSKLPSNQSGMWREWDIGGNAHSQRARPLHPGLHLQSKEMEPLVQIMQKYNQLRAEGGKQLKAINELKADKERSEAEDLWNQA